MSALLLALLLAQSGTSPAEARALFREGVEAYGRDDAAGAEAAFRKLLEHGMASAEVNYNLGTVCLAEGKLGDAVLYLERARRQGGGPDVDANLAIARGRVVDQVVGGAADEGLLTRLVAATSSEAAALAFLVPWCAGFVLLVARRLVRLARPAVIGAWLLLAAALPGAGLLLAHLLVHETVHEAVVIARTLPVRETPDASSKVSFELHAGSAVRLLASSGPFVRVRLPNGLEGWADPHELTPIVDGQPL
ncbi:MAG TPA: SH3 domain-containing protein [Myxococcaceae bacterium]|nr:SH3 domain-containing protein [Myxococcaceae bacterium]